MNITQEKLNKLKVARSEQQWNNACDEIKAARNGHLPSDWQVKVMFTGIKKDASRTWGNLEL